MGQKLKLNVAAGPAGLLSLKETYFDPSTNRLKLLGEIIDPAILTIGRRDYGVGEFSTDGGRIWYESADGGQNLEYTNLQAGGVGSNLVISPNLLDVMMFSWTVSGNNCIRHLSHDGGKTWRETYLSGGGEYCHWNQDTNNAYIGGWALWGGKKSVDDGSTLTTMNMTDPDGYPWRVPGLSNPIHFDSSDDESYVYCGNSANRSISRSTDQGTTWHEVSVGYDDSTIKDFTIVKCNDTGQYVCAYYGNYNRYVYLSDDYGLTFTTVPDSTDSFFSMTRDASLYVYNSASDSSVNISIDQGNNWTKLSVPFTDPDIRFTNDFATNTIYVWVYLESEIYTVNYETESLDLLVTLNHKVGNFTVSQYGKGAVYARWTEVAEIHNDLYYSRDYQGFSRVYIGEDLRYLMIL